MPASDEFQMRNPEIDNYLWILLQRARSLASRVRNLELAQYRLTIEQMSILHSLLIKGGSASIDEIAANVVRKNNSVSTLVDRMAKAGLVKKEKPKNKNKFLVTITPKAQKMVNMVPVKSIEMLFSNIDQNDKEHMARTLDQIIKTGLDLMGENYVPPFLTKPPKEITGHEQVKPFKKTWIARKNPLSPTLSDQLLEKI